VEPQFWQNRWRNGQIGFHQPSVDRSLERHWPALNLGPSSRGSAPRVFVPLCGKSLDLLWLRDQGHVVTGVELSATALEAFCMENGIPARRRIQDDFDVYEAGNLQLYRGDFFKLTPPILGETAAVYDRAALISWAPELRSAYADHIAALLRPRTEMLLITLEYPQEQMPGPPFSVPRAEVEQLYSRNFQIRELARQDILASEARFRSLGVTALSEVCYQLVRQ
jgi:thiopurine S-methyltransferase